MLTPRQLAVSVLTTIGGLTAAYLLGLPHIAGFAAGFLVLALCSRKQGHPWPDLLRYMRAGALHTMEVVWILLMVGLMIPAWTISGTIPYLIEQGLSWIHPAWMTTLTFWLSALFSMLLGTSTGTLSAVGIPMMGVAAVAGVPLPLMAGALVSGAFVGDRTSPFSSAHRLVADSTGTPVKLQARAMLPTTLLGLGAATAVFALFDWTGAWIVPAEALQMQAYRDAFAFHPLLILPALVLVAAILLRVTTRYAFLLSIVTAIILGTWLQGHDPLTWWNGLLWGYDHASLPSLHTKGVLNMVDLVLLIAMAGAFNGILESTRTLEPYMASFLGAKPSLPGATARIGLFGFILALVSCTQTLPIMMSGRSVLPLWTTRFPPAQLSRIVADTALVFAALIPWNMLAVLCATILNVPVHQYALFAVFLWILPICTWLISFLIQRKRSTAQYSQTLSG